MKGRQFALRSLRQRSGLSGVVCCNLAQFKTFKPVGDTLNAQTTGIPNEHSGSRQAVKRPRVILNDFFVNLGADAAAIF